VVPERSILTIWSVGLDHSVERLGDLLDQHATRSFDEVAHTGTDERI
jgi:hypothetical protein